MFPLSGEGFPSSSEELARGIREMVTAFVTLPEPHDSVVASGGIFPDVDALMVDISGGTIRENAAPPRPPANPQRRPGICAHELSVVGRNVRIRGGSLDLELHGRDVRFDFARSENHRPWLMLAGAARGHVELRVGMSDLRALVLQAARELAEPQRVSVEAIELSLASRGPRSAELDARVVARKLLLRGTMRVRGVLEIDDQLCAAVSELSAVGEGAVGTIAASMIQPKLKAVEGQQLALMGFALGGIALRDLHIDAGESGLGITADFGEPPAR
jgi:hypothetical protein